jgi:hypothetical protein
MQDMGEKEAKREAKRACSAKLAAFERIVCVTSSNACIASQLRLSVTCALQVLSTDGGEPVAVRLYFQIVMATPMQP